jgi:thiol:disulfide interchange protein
MALRWTRITSTVTILLVAAVFTACGAGPDSSGTTEPPAVAAVSAHETTKLDWERSWDNAFSRARDEDKPVLVSFEAEWCVWCKKLDSTTYRDARVASLITDSMVPLVLDVDGAGSELSETHRVDSLPTVLVLSPTGEERGRINGYLPPGKFFDAVTEILQRS